MSILLTLCAGSLRSRIQGKGEDHLDLLDVPRFAIRELQLRGLNLPASMLTGWGLEELDALRDRADKAGCPCLVLFDDQSLPFASGKAAEREQARDRARRLAVAANRLGCNAVAFHCDAPDRDESLERIADEIRGVMPGIERLELNVLLAPGRGLTASPERLTDLIKRVGGFRIGSLPTFGDAAVTGDAPEALKKLAPYAGAIHATIEGFTKAGVHSGCKLEACVMAIRSVGFVNTLAIDYRGAGDAVAAIDLARTQLQAAIDTEEPPPPPKDEAPAKSKKPKKKSASKASTKSDA